MSVVKSNALQLGQSLTASQNFTWYQPSTPDGTVRLGNGNSGSVTDLVTLTSAGALTLSGALSVTGNTTIGDAAGDTLTINGTAVSCPNNLNFDSNTLFIDAANNRVGIGTSSPGTLLSVLSGTANTAGDSITSAVATFTGPNWNFGTAANPAALQVMSNSTLGADVGATLGLGGRYTGTQFAQFAIIKGAKENAVDGNFSTYLAFGTRSNGGLISERMRIDSLGNVGIGETSPASWGKLAIYDSSAPTGTYLSVKGGYPGYAGAYGYGIKVYDKDNTTPYFSVASDYSLTINRFSSSGVYTTSLKLDSSGNLGLGVTPSAWGAGYKALQVGPAASLVSETNANTRLYNNAYFDGSTVKYVNSAQASQYLQFQGQHLWLSAPSGTAGNAITFTQAMTLDASGNLSLTGGNSLTQSSTSNSVFGTQNTGGGGNVYGGFQALTNQTFRIGTFGSSNAHNIEFVSQNNVRLVMNTSGTFYPAADNSITCGQNGNRWAAIWAANGTIQTSDLSTKTSILDSPLGLDFITSLRPVAYKFKVGKNTIIDNTETGYGKVVPVAGKRQHFGFIAQEVKAVLPDDLDFGGWIQTDLDDPNSEQGLRYDEFIAPIVKAIQELAAEIELLKSKLN